MYECHVKCQTFGQQCKSRSYLVLALIFFLQEVLREEQMVSRLMRQTQQEKRIAVQLMQIKQQKEVLRQNRIFQERQYQEHRLRDFQEALDREAVREHTCTHMYKQNNP